MLQEAKARKEKSPNIRLDMEIYDLYFTLWIFVANIVNLESLEIKCNQLFREMSFGWS